VFGIFRTAGYPEAVAYAMTALVTNVVPSAVWQTLPRPLDPGQITAHHRLGRRLATPHLPQGAPTSPALANLAAFRLDRRLSGLAASLELNYTRYADDLTFSGSMRLVRVAGTLRRAVAEISRQEGFTVNDTKSMLATRAGCQRVCGVVVNERLNVPRRDYDVLKAILHNATVHGPASQNRQALPDFRAHLLGRISWVASLNAARGEKLRPPVRADRLARRVLDPLTGLSLSLPRSSELPQSITLMDKNNHGRERPPRRMKMVETDVVRAEVASQRPC